MNLRLTYVLALVGIAAVANAQSIHNASSIFIPNSITVYAGDLNNSGFIQNNGTIEASGNWKNENVYQGLGTIILSGDDQLFDNHDQPVENLLIDGGGEKSLNGKLIITSSIDLASGIFKVGEDDTLLVRDRARVEGGSSASYVEGPMTIEGTGFRFFPVGRGGFYYPFKLTDVRGVSPVIMITAFKDLPDVRTSGEVAIDPSVYWTMNTTGGSFDGSPVSAPHHYEIADPERIVFVAGDDLEDEFQIVDNDGLESVGSMSFVVSKDPIARSIVAIGETPEKPVIPGYLSTSMSPNASNPDNRLIKFFGPDTKRENFNLQVFNRFGNTVFGSSSLDDMATVGWDGKSGGQLLPAGAYPYRITYVNRRGKEETRSGFITIVY
jgi:gliding motility-associated-like protein